MFLFLNVSLVSPLKPLVSDLSVTFRQLTQSQGFVGFSLTFVLRRKSCRVIPTRSSSAPPHPSVRRSRTRARRSSWSSRSCVKVSARVFSTSLTRTLAAASSFHAWISNYSRNLNSARQNHDSVALTETASCFLLLCFLSGQTHCFFNSRLCPSSSCRLINVSNTVYPL